MLIIVETMNPLAFEIHRDGRSIGTVRKDWPGQPGWCVVIPSEAGATAVPLDVMAKAIEFINQRSLRHHRVGGEAIGPRRDKGMTMQYREFQDGCFVIHKMMVNGHKYSAWFGTDGKLFSAERFSRDGQTTFNVPFSQHEVIRQLEQLARPYVKAPLIDTTGVVVETTGS
jgi:hypothetical protein